MTALDDPDEGTGDPEAYDGQAVDHLDTDEGQAEVGRDMPAGGHEVAEMAGSTLFTHEAET